MVERKWNPSNLTKKSPIIIVRLTKTRWSVGARVSTFPSYCMEERIISRRRLVCLGPWAFPMPINNSSHHSWRVIIHSLLKYNQIILSSHAARQKIPPTTFLRMYYYRCCYYYTISILFLHPIFNLLQFHKLRQFKENKAAHIPTNHHLTTANKNANHKNKCKFHLIQTGAWERKGCPHHSAAVG